MTSAGRHWRDDGFTLLEVLIGLLLASAVAAGVAHLVGLALVSIRDARESTAAVALAVQKLEQLRASAASGTPVTPSPDDALQTSAPGFAERVDASGLPVLAGVEIPRTTVYVRRWRVWPLSAGSGLGWVFHVVVNSQRRDASAASPSGPRSPAASDAFLATIWVAR
jgi:prepilin-type N-terminal cleavage/methylation domain-containing protein